MLFLTSANAHIYPPAGLKPRYLATGTGISLPSTTSPPYPTTSTNIPSAPISSISPTSTPTPTASEFFYLVAANTNTSLDGSYIYIGSDDAGNLVLYLAPAPDQVASFSKFNINADGTLQNEFSGGIASVYPGAKYGSLWFNPEAFTESQGYTVSFCGIVGGELNCRTGADTVFSVCPYQDIEGHVEGGEVVVGVVAEPGCTGLSLLVVPV